MKKKKILVTGATGFIGKAVMRILAENNYTVISHKEVGLDITNPFTFNFTERNNISHVVHLAGKTFVPDSWKNPSEYFTINATGTQHVAEFCRNVNARLIYISAFVYGNVLTHPIPESHPANANNPYAFSKKTGEEICLFYNRIFHLPVTIVRPFNVYGPGQNSMFLIPEVIEQIRIGNKIHVRNLQPKRDFIFVDDVATMILMIIQRNKDGIFNAGSGTSHSVKELIDIIQKVMKTDLPVVSDETERFNEISDTIADISKATKELNWKPLYNLETGIKKIVESN